MYLTSFDYLKQIQDVNLQQIINGNATVLSSAQLAAEAECKSYLRQKYDVEKEFTPTNAWSAATAYNAGDRVFSGTDIYFAKYPKDQFDLYAAYAVGDEVFYKNKTWRCKSATQALSQASAIQYGTIQALPNLNQFPDAAGQSQWTDLGAYSVNAGTALNDTTKWTKADNRDPQLVMYCIDICLYHLHSRIAPRNVPQLRIDRYEAATEWLKMCAVGDITPNLPVLQPKQGRRIRYGGNVKNVNSY